MATSIEPTSTSGIQSILLGNTRAFRCQTLLFLLPAVQILSRVADYIGLSEMLKDFVVHWRASTHAFWDWMLGGFDFGIGRREYDALTLALLSAGAAAGSVMRGQKSSLIDALSAAFALRPTSALRRPKLVDCNWDLWTGYARPG